jgi:hypothetical protein
MNAHRLRFALPLALALLLGVVRVGAGPEDDASPPAAAEAVQATLEIERTLLREDMDHHERIAAERAKAVVRLNESYAELDAALERNDTLLAKALDEARAKIVRAEAARAELLAEEGALLEKMQDRLRRIRLLEEKLASFQERAHDVGGPLSGRWDVTLLPSGQGGVFALMQSGTLVSGTYQLEGGWSGSLQGTLINRKVHLERIDSKQGRSAEFEGFLSSDGSRIRGTWRSYELAARDPASGQWSAVRRPAS